jgi:hypothetical protein
VVVACGVNECGKEWDYIGAIAFFWWEWDADLMMRSLDVVWLQCSSGFKRHRARYLYGFALAVCWKYAVSILSKRE